MRLRHVVPCVVLAGVAALGAQTIVPNAASIQTASGVFQVPGKAYLDGRTGAARGTSPVSVALHQAPGDPHVACRLEHATEVTLLEVQRNEAEHRYYFRAKTARCDGWVGEGALSVKRPAPADDRSK